MKNQITKSAMMYLAILKSRMLRKRIPIIANILITNRCNLKCFYCYPDVFNRRLPDMSIDMFHKVIDICKVKGTKMVEFLGGEPFLMKNLYDYVSYASEKGMICEITTNGYFVKNHLDSLKLFDSVCVSIDGDEESNDKNRGRGSYKKAVECLDFLQKHNIPTRLHAVITRNNKSSIRFLAEMAKDRGLNIMLISPAKYADRDYPREAEEKWLSRDEYKEVLKEVIDLKRQGYPFFHSYTALNFCLNWPYEFERVIKKNEECDLKKIIKCTAKYYQFWVDADGTYFMTCQETFDIKGKKIQETDFDEWWQDPDQYNCRICAVLPQLDKSLMYNMHPEAVYNMVRNVLTHFH